MKKLLLFFVLIQVTIIGQSQTMSILFKDGHNENYDMNKIESITFSESTNNQGNDEEVNSNIDYVIVTIDGVTTKNELPKGFNFGFSCKGEEGAAMNMIEFGGFQIPSPHGVFSLLFTVSAYEDTFLTHKVGTYTMPDGLDYVNRIVYDGYVKPFEACAYYEDVDNSDDYYSLEGGTFSVEKITKTTITFESAYTVGYTIVGQFDCTLSNKSGNTKKCNGKYSITVCF